MTLQFGVLGPLEVRRDGVRLDLGAPKQRAVLAQLLLARGRVVASDRLVDVAWGDRPPPSALPSLQVYISNLRRLLRDGGVSPLTRRAPGYLLEPAGHEIDLDLFGDALQAAVERLDAQDWRAAATAAQQAVASWRGDVLADLGPADWLEPEAQALREQLVHARRVRVTALLGTSELTEAVTAAQALTRDEPFRDDVARLEVLALHRSGRTAEALEVLRLHAARLDDELGLEVSTELRDLQTALLRQEPWTLRWPLSSTAPATASAPVPIPLAAVVEEVPDAPSGSFIGRGPQLDVARQAISEVLAGSPAWLVLTGPAGIGKTRLAEETLSLFERQGGRAVRARCLEEAGAPAWWPLRQVVVGLGEDPEEVLRVPSGAEADLARFQVYERVRTLLEQVAEDRPLAVLVDDLQWADETSLRALSYLATAMSTGRLLVVATVRDTESGQQARRTASEVLRLARARQVVVPPLSNDDVVALATSVAGEQLDEDEARTLAARTGGNALFVTEYARLSSEERRDGDVPLAVRGVLGRRLESLDTGVLQALRAAAVIGDVLDLDLLATVTRSDPDDLLDLLDDAVDEQIVVPRPDGSGYAFSHALLREEVLAGMSPIRRQQMHLRVAAALATQGGERLTRRAQHLLAARPLADPRELLEACRAAALQAEERWSSETAVGWWESAQAGFDLLPHDEQDPQERDDLVIAQIEALARSGRGTTVLQMVDERVTEALHRGRPATVGRLSGALLRAYGTWPWVAFGAESVQLAHRLASLEEFVARDVASHARLLAAVAVGLCYDTDARLPDDASTRGLALAERTGDPDVIADALLGRVLTYVGVADHAEECEALLERMLALPRVRADADTVFAHSARTMSRTLLGDLAGAEEHLRLGIAGSDLYRLPVIRVQLRWMEVGVTAWREGPDQAMAKHAAAAAAHARADLYEVGFTTMAMMMLRWQQGRLADEPPYAYDLEQHVWRAARAAQVGDVEEAEHRVAARLAEPGPMVWASLGHIVVLAHVVADLGLTAYAEQLIELLTPRSGRLAIVGQGPILGPVDLALARLHDLTGDADTALRLAASGRELCLTNGNTWWAERCETLTGPPTASA